MTAHWRLFLKVTLPLSALNLINQAWHADARRGVLPADRRSRSRSRSAYRSSSLFGSCGAGA